MLYGTAQVEFACLQQQALFRYGEGYGRVRLFHVQLFVLIHQQVLVQTQVVAVGVELAFVKGLNVDARADLLFDFFPGKDHNSLLYLPLLVSPLPPRLVPAPGSPARRQMSTNKGADRVSDSVKGAKIG